MRILPTIESAAKFTLLEMIRGYRELISPFMPAVCRFEPSCSQYASEAIERYGIIKGCALALKRLIRCHPWGGCGCDPVP